MAINKCKHSFTELSGLVFPKYMVEMRKKITSSYEMAIFAEKGVGIVTAREKLKLQEDFPGCYVLIESGNPIYVGISKLVISRLVQHVKGATHSQASVAYNLANDGFDHDRTRAGIMQDPNFKERFKDAKGRIANMNVAYIKIENDLEKYLFEAYCAMELDTNKWNTFETH